MGEQATLTSSGKLCYFSKEITENFLIIVEAIMLLNLK
jgi:hypothetical protein